MGSSEDFQAGIWSGLGWWNPGRSLFPPCSDFMWSGSTLNEMDHQAEVKQAPTAYTRSDDSDDHHSSSTEHHPVMSPDYAHIFQDVQKPLMADFGASYWLQNSLLNDVSSNMPIFKPVADDDHKKNNNNSQGFYNLDQFDTTNIKVSQMGLGNVNTASSYAYSSMLQNLAGPDTDMSYNFDNKFTSSATNFMQSTYQKQQQNPGTKQGSLNPVSSPFWNSSWMGSEEIGAQKSHQILVPALFEDQKPHSVMSTPKIESKNLSHKLANSTLLGTKRAKNASDELYKRPRIETPSSLPTFKVRKEKLGDRITALQQLVSPFGKTDTASVLHEAVEYIKFLHDQVSVLRTPYMQSGTPTNQQQLMQAGESKNTTAEGPKQDLRSRGLCLVPISSTFPVANESTADFWTPTFGGTMTFR